ncbi:MAG: TlpA family protein disulfide reductase [Actinobacteria bacterium]|nr:TlpA family protein disulfide reductase [Actinomycetota bacterium]
MPPQRPWKLALVAVLVLATACGASAPAAECVEVPGGRSCVDVIAPEDREAAPDQVMPTVEGDGELGLSAFRGDVVVLNFWASWCGPCRREQPDLNEAHEALAGDGVSFLGVDLQDSRSNAQAHVREFEIPYPSLYDPDSSYAARFAGISPSAIPSTFLIDREGRVAVRLYGTTTAAELAALVPHVAQ